MDPQPFGEKKRHTHIHYVIRGKLFNGSGSICGNPLLSAHGQVLLDLGRGANQNKKIKQQTQISAAKWLDFNQTTISKNIFLQLTGYISTTKPPSAEIRNMFPDNNHNNPVASPHLPRQRPLLGKAGGQQAGGHRHHLSHCPTRSKPTACRPACRVCGRNPRRKDKLGHWVVPKPRGFSWNPRKKNWAPFLLPPQQAMLMKYLDFSGKRPGKVEDWIPPKQTLIDLLVVSSENTQPLQQLGNLLVSIEKMWRKA